MKNTGLGMLLMLQSMPGRILLHSSSHVTHDQVTKAILIANFLSQGHEQHGRRFQKSG